MTACARVPVWYVVLWYAHVCVHGAGGAPRQALVLFAGRGTGIFPAHSCRQYVGGVKCWRCQTYCRQECKKIPAGRNGHSFLPAVIAVQEMHCNAKNVHLGLPWGAAGAMDGFEPSVACVELNQMLRRLNIRVVVVGFDFVQGPMTPLQVQIFPSFKDAYSAYQV